MLPLVKAARPAAQLASGGPLTSTVTCTPRCESASSARVRKRPRHSSTSGAPRSSTVDFCSSSANAALTPPSSAICCSRARSSAARAASAPFTVRAAAKVGDGGAVLTKLAGVRSPAPFGRRARRELVDRRRVGMVVVLLQPARRAARTGAW
jgi:hypothetical protein